jgi:para-nitrobenzyl esterase
MNRRELFKQTAFCTGAALVSRALKNCAFAAEPASPEASITTGRIRGYVDRGIRVFKGIPYGADTALRRFMAPAPPMPWTGVRETINFGHRAPQASRSGGRGTGYHLPPELGPVSEDCLYLNVWTSAKATTDKLRCWYGSMAVDSARDRRQFQPMTASGSQTTARWLSASTIGSAFWDF